MTNLYTKFEVTSLSRSGYILWGVEFQNESRDPATPLSGMIFHRQGGTDL